jgi:hypothetical protein
MNNIQEEKLESKLDAIINKKPHWFIRWGITITCFIMGTIFIVLLSLTFMK